MFQLLITVRQTRLREISIYFPLIGQLDESYLLVSCITFVSTHKEIVHQFLLSKKVVVFCKTIYI